MTQTIQKNQYSFKSQFFNIEMSATILLFLCVVWFFIRDIWITDTQAFYLASKDNIFQILNLPLIWYDFTTRMVVLCSIFTITLSMLLHTQKNIGIIPLFLICVMISFLYHHTYHIHFIISPVTFFSLLTLYSVAFERFFLTIPSFSNHIITIFLFAIAGFFSIEMSLGMLPAFIVTAILYNIWKKYPASNRAGECFMVICGTICGIASGVQFFGHDILTQDFISLSLPIFGMGLCWAFYIFVMPIFKNYKISEPLLASFISMMIFGCAIYIGHLDYMILNQI